jgi:hypothetical protein
VHAESLLSRLGRLDGGQTSLSSTEERDETAYAVSTV